MVDIGSSYGSCLDVFDGQNFMPAGETVDHGEEVFEALGLRERSNQIDVDVVEPLFCWFEFRQRSSGVSVNLCPLTLDASPGPLGYLLRHSMPDEFGRYYPLRSPRTRVG